MKTKLLIILALLLLPLAISASNINFSQNPWASFTSDDGWQFSNIDNQASATWQSNSYLSFGANYGAYVIVTMNEGSSTFTLNSIDLRGTSWSITMTIEGYNGSTLVKSQNVTVNSSSWQTFSLSGFTGINKIKIINPSNFAGPGIDNIDFTVPNAAPTDISITNSSLVDGSTSGTIVGTLSSTDNHDLGGHTYTFASGGTDNSSFTLSGSDLITAFTADVNTKSSYVVKIRSTDSEGLYFEKNITITVNPPATVWTGAVTTFSKEFSSDCSVEANQDCITPNIWLTCDDLDQLLFNYKTEEYSDWFSSPEGTEWATGVIGNYNSLSYASWPDWTSWDGSSVVGQDAVLHLISEDIYISIKFTSWTSTGYSYERSTDQTMPVELISFSGQLINETVTLNWETATEVNNYGFQVERKKIKDKSEEEWESMGFVQGNGTTNSPKEYSFTDDHTLNPNHNLTRLDYRLKQIDNDGTFEYSKVVTVDLSNITDVDDEVDYVFELSQNYPNPFNPTTSIAYQVANIGNVSLIVYNTLGQKVATLVNEQKSPGKYEVEFDGSNLTSGMYFYKLTSGEFTQTKKLMLLK